MYKQETLDALCPCGKDKALKDCCYLAISGAQPAPTAKKLMRSRYTAYVLGDVNYLLKTLAPEQHQKDEKDLLNDQVINTQWLGLDIQGATKGSRKDSEGQVTFEATFKAAQESGVMRETSRFRRNEANEWLYVEGDVEVILDN